MNKKMLCLLVVLMMTALLAVGVFAADPAVVYVQHGATGTGASAEDPIGGLVDALDVLNGNGGTIYLCGMVPYYQDLKIPEQANDLTITAAEGTNGKLVFTDTLTLAKNSNANTVTFDMPLVTDADGVTIFGAFNSVHFGKNFTVDGTLDFYGGVVAGKSPSSTYNGYVQEKTRLNRECTTELPYTITVDNGDFRVFNGGNYRAEKSSVWMIGSIAAKIDIIINGGSFNSEVSYGVNDALKLDPAFSISGMAMLADAATLTITGGDFNTPIYAQGYLGLTSTTSSAGSRLVVTDEKYYAADGDITITITGGDFTDCIEISAEQVAASYNRLLRGNFTLSIGEDAILADGIVLDATQVKAYPDENGNTPAGSPVATLIYAATATVVPKRFDSVTGAVQAELPEPIRIACIGDSITQGSRASVTDPDGTKWEDFGNGSYPAQLYKKAVELGHDVIISNYGCGATKVMDRGGLWYNAGLAYTLAMEETDANYFVVGLGTNDAASTTYTYGMADRFYEEYKALIAGFEALPCTDMVYGTSAIYRSGSDVPAVSNIRAMQGKALEDLAADGKKATYVDLYALTLDAGLDGRLLWEGDNLHPDIPGYKVYADAIYNAVLAENPVVKVENFEMDEIWVATKANGGNDRGTGTEDDPTTKISVAFAKAKDGTTIHIIGEYPYTKMAGVNYGFSTPMQVSNLKIVGENNAVLKINSEHFFVKSDLEIDNITLAFTDVDKDGKLTAQSSVFDPMCISLGYHNVTLGEGFRSPEHTVVNSEDNGVSDGIDDDGIQGGTVLVAGYVALSEDKDSMWYNSRESISASNDCVIYVKGGTYRYFIGGNYLYTNYVGSKTVTYEEDGKNKTKSVSREYICNYAPCIYGTYSGNMTINIGSGVTILEDVRNGAVGQNYLTGSVTLNANAWPEGAAIREYSWIGNVTETKSYNAAKNTGTVTINLAEGMTNTIAKARDINKDGTVDLADALLIVKYAIGGTDAEYDNDTYFDQTAFKMSDALYALKKAVQ